MVPLAKTTRMAAGLTSPQTSPMASPAALAADDSTQSLPAWRTTELLQRRTQSANELLVAPWAGAAKFFGIGPLLIALARRATRHLDGITGRFGFEFLTCSFTPTSALFVSAALSLLTGSIAFVGTPLRPSSCRSATSLAAITSQRIKSTKRPLATFQQAATLPTTDAGDLI